MSYSSEVMMDSPALWWRLGESAGTEAADSSGNARVGTYGEGVTLAQTSLLVNEPANTAVTLSGTSTGRITSTYGPFVEGTTRTFEGWARRTNSAGQDTLFGSDTGGATPCYLRLEAGAPAAVRFYPKSGNFAEWAAAWPGNDQNVHWVLVYNDSAKEAELFINGVSKGKKGTTDNWAAVIIGNFKVGTWFSTNLNPWHGKQDEVAIYTSGLSEARIKAHYDAGIAEPSKAVASFPLSRRNRLVTF